MWSNLPVPRLMDMSQILWLKWDRLLLPYPPGTSRVDLGSLSTRKIGRSMHQAANPVHGRRWPDHTFGSSPRTFRENGISDLGDVRVVRHIPPDTTHQVPVRYYATCMMPVVAHRYIDQDSGLYYIYGNWDLTARACLFQGSTCFGPIRRI